MAELCGIIGIGQTKHDTARKDVSIPGLVREAALRALEDAASMARRQRRTSRPCTSQPPPGPCAREGG